MPCPVCKKPIHLLPGPHQNTFSFYNHRVYHVECLETVLLGVLGETSQASRDIVIVKEEMGE